MMIELTPELDEAIRELIQDEIDDAEMKIESCEAGRHLCKDFGEGNHSRFCEADPDELKKWQNIMRDYELARKQAE